MIQIADKSKCCGCNACGDACGHQAIRFLIDEEGFWYPHVDESKCVDCGLCEKVCPILRVEDYRHNDFQEPVCFAANHKNLEIRFDSTSGGCFSALAQEIYKKKGFVGGAIYRDDFSAVHYISDQKEDLKKLRSSKYVQSDAIGFYKQVKECCETGRHVLVCGTPCQMVALRAYLHKNYENLIIVDFICHSVASPKAHRKYFDYLEDLYQSKAVYFKAKNKQLGWRSLTKVTRFANGKSHYGVKGEDYYSLAYHSGMIDRPSCYECPFKGYPRMADITLADFWDKNHVASVLDDNIGTSAVIINSQKGWNLFDKISYRLQKQSITIKDIEPSNPALLRCVRKPVYNRTLFFTDMDTMRFDELGNKYFPPQSILKKRSRLHEIHRVFLYLKAYTEFQWKPLYQFLRLNFFHPGIHTDWRKNALIYPTPYCVFQVDRRANVEIEGPVRVGVKRIKGSKLETRILFEADSHVRFEGEFRLRYGADVEVFKGAELVMGANSGSNMGLTLICGDKIHVGSHTFLGREVSIRDTNGGHIIALQGYKNTNPVIVGDFCWLCSGCKIMPGVTIGDNTIVGANAMVISPLPARVLAVGSPARVIETEISWKH
jgi:acetyltransferase-like isoleucine patch superfamily enzyme/coenzyme F420-reducing hydrogenase beta subunit